MMELRLSKIESFFVDVLGSGLEVCVRFCERINFQVKTVFVFAVGLLPPRSWSSREC